MTGSLFGLDQRLPVESERLSTLRSGIVTDMVLAEWKTTARNRKRLDPLNALMSRCCSLAATGAYCR
jgi:hypothetical protein